MDNTPTVCLDLTGKYNKEEIDRVGEMLVEGATPEQLELFAIPFKHNIPIVIAPLCMSIFRKIDQDVAEKNPARSQNPEKLSKALTGIIDKLARSYGVDEEEFIREGGFQQRAIAAIKEIGCFNLRLRKTGKDVGIYPVINQTDSPKPAVSPAPVALNVANAEKKLRESAGPMQKQILAILDKYGISPIMGPRFELAWDILSKTGGINSKLIDHAGKVLAQDYAEIMGCQPIAKNEATESPVITAFREYTAMIRASTLGAMECESQAIN